MTGWPAMRENGDLAGVYRNQGLAAFVGGMFDAAHRGELDTWDIQWAYSCVAQRRMCVVPHVNLVTNIGFSGTREPGESVGLPSSDFGAPAQSPPITMLPGLHVRGPALCGTPPDPHRPARLRGRPARGATRQVGARASCGRTGGVSVRRSQEIGAGPV